MVPTPARPEPTTTDTTNPLDNEVEGGAPDGDSANLDEPNIPGASSEPTNARIDESARIDEGTRLDKSARIDERARLDESARIDERARLDESARIDERARVDKRASVDKRARGGLAETQPQAQEVRGGDKDRPRRVKKPVSKFA